MLAIVTPEVARARRGGLPALGGRRPRVVGRVAAADADGVGRLRIRVGAGRRGRSPSVPASSLADDAPRYERRSRRPPTSSARRADDPAGSPAPADCGADLLRAPLRPLLDLSPVRPPALPQHRASGPGEADAAVLKLAAPGRRLDRQGPRARAPTPTRAGARSIPAPGPRRPSPSRRSTSPAPAPDRSRSSTA